MQVVTDKMTPVRVGTARNGGGDLTCLPITKPTCGLLAKLDTDLEKPNRI